MLYAPFSFLLCSVLFFSVLFFSFVFSPLVLFTPPLGATSGWGRRDVPRVTWILIDASTLVVIEREVHTRHIVYIHAAPLPRAVQINAATAMRHLIDVDGTEKLMLPVLPQV